jgi:hypothetical protein
MRTFRLFLILAMVLTGCKKEKVPVLTTADILSVTQTSAICGGDVTSQGTSEVIEKGICWSISDNPTIQDSITVDSLGLGSFIHHLTGLDPGTEYFVKAYATNSSGTGYGETKSFTTNPATIPTVVTYSFIPVTQTSAQISGDIWSNGESPIGEYGFCWSTSQNPTLSDNCITVKSVYSNFHTTIINLEPGLKYYSRAYATNHVGTAYGDIVTFTTCSEVPNESIIGTWQLVSDYNCQYFPQTTPAQSTLEITSDSVFTQYVLGDISISSSFSINPGMYGFDSLYFHKPSLINHYLYIKILDCNNLQLQDPHKVTFTNPCEYFKRIK